VTLHAKPWTTRNGDRFSKHAFTIRLGDGVVECPAGQTTSLAPSRAHAQFAAETCQRYARRPQCTTV
jgi:hypothetical protein